MTQLSDDIKALRAELIGHDVKFYPCRFGLEDEKRLFRVLSACEEMEKELAEAADSLESLAAKVLDRGSQRFAIAGCQQARECLRKVRGA